MTAPRTVAAAELLRRLGTSDYWHHKDWIHGHLAVVEAEASAGADAQASLARLDVARLTAERDDARRRLASYVRGHREMHRCRIVIDCAICKAIADTAREGHAEQMAQMSEDVRRRLRREEP